MARVSMSDKVCVFQYKGHKFYVDTRNEDSILLHLDPRGRVIDSGCMDEDEAIIYIDEGLNASSES